MDTSNLTPKKMRKGKNGKRGTRYYDEKNILVAKTCTSCGEPHPISDFPVAKSQTDGHASSCSNCTRNYQKNYYRSGPVNPNTEGREKYAKRSDQEIHQYLSIKYPDGTKECTLCHHIKPLTEYYQNKSNPSVVQSRCKECMKSRGSRQ